MKALNTILTILSSLILLLLFSSPAYSISITSTATTTLGIDPEGSARLNGGSFQQETLTTYRGYQYVAYYESSGTYARQHLVLGRRPSGGNNPWSLIKFTDYVQSTIDGHNTISMGISGDGKIHLSFDHHDVPLNYRVSQAQVANNPTSFTWSTSLFGSVIHSLPGASGTWTPLTYPRFERVPNGDLLMEFRIGASGAGNSYLYLYSVAANSWSSIGRYLQGSNNNAYINGLDLQNNRLHTSWTWRETPDVVTNHDLGYAYSDDLGRTWRNSAGASLGATITPTSPGIHVFTIPQNSGILNQEAQTIDPSGRFHVLNREVRSGVYTWFHYHRSTTGAWTRAAIPASLGQGTPTATGRRGKLAIHPATGSLIALIPNNSNYEVTIMAATPEGGFTNWKVLWRGNGYDTEPLVDKYALKDRGVLSVFLRTSGSYPSRRLTVVEFGLGA